MRVYILIALFIGMSIYAWRNWFIPLCVLIIFDAVMKHDDMPRSLFGIQGLNLWNILLICVFLSWLVSRLSAPAPAPGARVSKAFILLCAAYMGIIVIAAIRGMLDGSSIRSGNEDYSFDFTPLGFISDYLVNPIKYIVTALLLFEAARTRKNLLLAMSAVFGQALLYSVQVVKYIPPSTLLYAENSSRNRIQKECGLHANDMALVMVVAFWGMMACLPLWKRLRWWWKLPIAMGAPLVAVALALCQSRGGFLAFVCVGLAFGVLRWRRILLLFPVALVAAAFAFPSMTSRVLEGVGVTNVAGQVTQNLDEISAGRLTNIWPPTIEEIGNAPLFGQGRLTILRTQLFDRILAAEGDVPTHPHNAYLEMLLDSGMVGLLITLMLFVGVPIAVFAGWRSADPLLIAARDTGLAAAIGYLVMGVSGQTFFPREGVFVVLCGYGIMGGAYMLMLAQRAPALQGVAQPPMRRIPMPAPPIVRYEP